MSDHVRPCNLKPQQRDLTPVLRRPVEPAPQERTSSARSAMSEKCQDRDSCAAAISNVDELLESKLPDVVSCLVLGIRLPGFSSLDFQNTLANSGIRFP